VETRTRVELSGLFTNLAARVCLIYKTWCTNAAPTCLSHVIYWSTRREVSQRYACPTNVTHVVPGSVNYAVSAGCGLKLVQCAYANICTFTCVWLTHRTHGHARMDANTDTNAHSFR